MKKDRLGINIITKLVENDTENKSELKGLYKVYNKEEEKKTLKESKSNGVYKEALIKALDNGDLDEDIFVQNYANYGEEYEGLSAKQILNRMSDSDAKQFMDDCGWSDLYADIEEDEEKFGGPDYVESLGGTSKDYINDIKRIQKALDNINIDTQITTGKGLDILEDIYYTCKQEINRIEKKESIKLNNKKVLKEDANNSYDIKIIEYNNINESFSDEDKEDEEEGGGFYDRPSYPVIYDFNIGNDEYAMVKDYGEDGYDENTYQIEFYLNHNKYFDTYVPKSWTENQCRRFATLVATDDSDSVDDDMYRDMVNKMSSSSINESSKESIEEILRKEIEEYFKDIEQEGESPFGDREEFYNYINKNWFSVDRELFDKIYDELSTKVYNESAYDASKEVTGDAREDFERFIVKDVNDLRQCNTEEELSEMLLDKLGACDKDEWKDWLDTYMTYANDFGYNKLTVLLSEYIEKRFPNE